MDVQKLLESYRGVVPQAERLRSSLQDQLVHLLNEADVSLGVPIESRVKEWESISEKLKRKSIVLEEIRQLDDLVGVRLILLFSRDLDSVGKILNDHLKVVSSEDKTIQLGETNFGYQSQHFVVEIPAAWLQLPTWRDLGGMRIEIQVRTLAQHIWAAVSHKLQYKQELGVPPPLRRAIHRASALLETVDVEFDRLLEARDIYLNNKGVSADPDEPLNVDLVEAILTKVFPAANKTYAEGYDELLDDLLHFGVFGSGVFEGMLKRHYSAIMMEDKRLAQDEGGGAYFQLVGLAREALRNEFGDEKVRDYLLNRRRA